MRRCVSAGLVVVGVIAACGDERSAFDVTSTPAFGVDAGAEAGADAAVPDCVGKVRCSRDLHAVVDACDESRVIQTCPPDQACGEGVCRPACDPVVGANGSTGCEFVALPAPPEMDTVGSCFAAFITNTWGTPTRIEAEYDGKALDLAGAARTVRTNGADVTYDPFTGELQPGEVAVLFLSQSPVGFVYWTPCPDGVTPAVMRNTGKSGTGRTPSFWIKTTAPVSAYSLYPFGGATSYVPSASLLLPVASWKTSYIVTAPWETVFGSYSATTGIVAAEDDTEVTVIGSQHILGGYEVDSAEKGVPHKYKLRRGEHLQFAQELTGSRITSNKKVGVWAGHEAMTPPREGVCCADSEQLQLLPVSSWGHHYVVVPYLSRSQGGLTEEYFFRLTGAVDGTVLTYEPSRPREAPETLSAGESVLIRTTAPFIVSSQDGDHPFAAFSYMTGEQWASAVVYDGDPEFTFVVPTEQYLGHYVFFVDPSYRNSQLVVVRAREPGKDFAPVRLDCAGPLDGWQPVGTSGQYEYTRIHLTKDFEPQKIGNGTCSAGRREIDSASPIAVTVWGTDAWSSYGYPSGASLRPLNTVDLVVK
jgi:IgGFc binding protein